ncbi:peptidylprolyl isomerase [Actinokineospora sp.]|uniref:peptidylprolyl isomerase n=1 Tax=Actinokineospora sp. TaxID=1872133 RepID=UPI0040383BD9
MTLVALTTSHGPITLELDRDKAPQTVDNFVQYVEAGHYDNTIFHRVIAGFMVQGGGFTADMAQKPAKSPIQNEAANGLLNVRYSVAMARTSDPHSASAQFFVNVADNDFLNHTSPTPRGWGYAVFGKVIEGFEVVDEMAKARTGTKSGMSDVPVEAITILSAKVA